MGTQNTVLHSGVCVYILCSMSIKELQVVFSYHCSHLCVVTLIIIIILIIVIINIICLLFSHFFLHMMTNQAIAHNPDFFYLFIFLLFLDSVDK